MAILKCKMCGGDLDVTTDEKVVECEYCGCKQTIISPNDEKKINLSNRANRLRINCEFDKAAGIYEQIIAEFPEEAEAYWGLCLCNYGIEYVDDPVTANKIPTCHRASFDKMRKDENYELALENADMVQRIVYEDQAKEIDRIMGEILAVSRDEEPYDIFICYKESDNIGSRTPDSVLAQDIYDALTKNGYRVFFSRITLEDKLGTQYEPYIFSALNSAKIMLVVGTDYEYLNAVWVKNEWSRFLKLIAKDKSKVLIPCYQNMDPYDMPDEFKGLQSQDCSKLGFMQDLLRGIDKLFGRTEKQVVQQTVITNGPQVSSLLERAFMFLEDEDWDSADEYSEKVLDIEPKNANAYLIKLLVDLKLTKEAELESLNSPFDNNANYEKTCRFDDALKSRLNSYITTINDRNEKAAEEARKAKEKAYQEKIAKLNKLVEYAKAHDDSFEERIHTQLNKLAGEKTTLQDQKTSIENAPSMIASLKSECDCLDSQLKVIEAERAKLGIFAGSKKRDLDSKILGLKSKFKENEKSINRLNALSSNGETVESIASKIAEIERNITKLQNELNEFNNREQSNENIDDLINILGDEVIVEYLKNNDSIIQILITCSKTKNMIIKEGLVPISFGSYAGEKIEWQILDNKDDRIFVITKDLIECKRYNTERTDITWESCSLRKWLNNDFYNKAFSDDEKALIQTTNVVNKDNAEYGTKGGNDTKDKVFLLSIDEANQYFTSDSEGQCQGTSNAKSNGLYVVDNGNSHWWLRSPGDEQDEAACVHDGGLVIKRGNRVHFHILGVRPAMWINLES